MTFPRHTRPALKALRAQLDDWLARGELAARAPGLLALALREESVDQPTPSVGLRRRLAKALAVRLGADPSGPSETEASDLSLWRGQPGLSGEIYLELLARLDPQAGRKGQVFTPWPLALHLAGLLEPDPAQRWLDPAAGAGIFLQAATALGADPARCAALEPDEIATALGRTLLPATDWRCGDALAEWSGLPAAWRGGFERVILNPPFRNGVERRDEAWVRRRGELKERFVTARGPFDLYVPFVERALDLLAPSGRLGLLLPTTWLASRYGQALRRHLAERADLLRLQHAPGCRLFARANVDLLFLVLGRRGGQDPPLRVERLDKGLATQACHSVRQAAVRQWAAEGWGPLLYPPERLRLRALTPPLGESHAVAASLTADEYYRLDVQAGGTPGPGQLLLLSSGALEPFCHTWGRIPVRFRGASLERPLVRLDSLGPSRRRQVGAPRVLVANLSRRLEAVAVAPDTALGVVNVIQVPCADLGGACALAAWLNSAPLQDHIDAWHSPLRMNSQLSLTRGLVAGLPAPPQAGRRGETKDALRLRELGNLLARLGASGALATDAATRARREVDEIAESYLPVEVEAAISM